MDTCLAPRENRHVTYAGASRRRIARTLTAAYAGGLLSHDTFTLRVDQLLGRRVVDPASLVGDLTFRDKSNRLKARLSRLARARWGPPPGSASPPVLLALDWTGGQTELLIGRHESCDIVVSDLTVSRRHARLVFRDSKWIVLDLRSTNGTEVNGIRIGRCEVRPGDSLLLGHARLRVD